MHPSIRCCCGTAAPGIRIEVYRALTAYAYSSRVYSGQIADPGDCSNEEVGSAPEYTGETAPTWGCFYTRANEPFDQYVGGLNHHWNLCSEVVSGESVWVAGHTWFLPFDSSRTEHSSGTWKCMTSGGLVTTTATAFVSQQVDDYTVTESRPAALPTGDGCHSCTTEAGSSSSVTVDASYWHRGTYRYDMDAFQVYADSGAHSGWTIEITGGNCIVKNGGTTMYTWSLASYTVSGLKSAIGATSELSAIGGLAVLSSVGTMPSTVLPSQGPVAVGISSGPCALVLRRAGDEFEDYQTFAYPRYEIDDFNPDATVFEGTEAEFAAGFEIYWSAAAIALGDHMADLVAPTITVDLSSFGDCFDEFAAAIDPPTYVEPDCSGTPGGGIDSVPAGSGRANFAGDSYRPRTRSTYEFTSGGVTLAEWGADASDCNPFDTFYHCAAYTAAAYFGKRTKWQLTRT